MTRYQWYAAVVGSAALAGIVWLGVQIGGGF